jgi:hypothetical protein
MINGFRTAAPSLDFPSSSLSLSKKKASSLLKRAKKIKEIILMQKNIK